ncbi:MAG: DUF533 domain-containing protein [Ahniella sp.]|nr:DUF533 domain-containing protein [Ahniella sp.]
MFDPQKLLMGMVGDAMGGAFGGGRKKNKKGNSMFRTGNLAGKAALGLGALGVAMAAYEHFQQQKAAPAPVMPPTPTPTPVRPVMTPVQAGPILPPPPPPAFKLENLSAEEAEAVLLVQTMIAAAHADGLIDAEERARIVARAGEAGLDAGTRMFLEAQLASPPSPDELAARTRPDQVDEVYAAALLAIRIDSEAERRFLAAFAKKLGMDPTRQQQIQEALLTSA